MIGLGKRISYAFRCFFAIASRGEVPQDIAPEVVRMPVKTGEIARPAEVTAAPERQRAADSTDRAVQMLALFQRDGRLIDFFSEDITPYQDAQVGAAVRELHAGCRKVLDQYMKLEPIISGEEDRPVTVEPDFDPATVKLIGNVVGQPPLRGVLRHRGWRVSEMTLPPLPVQESGRSVIAPAEVELP